MEDSTTFQTGIGYNQDTLFGGESVSQPSEVEFFIRSSISPANPIRLVDTGDISADERRASIYAYLDKDFKEHTSKLVTSLNGYMTQMISGLFQELRTDIQNRKLYVLFEQALGCDPMTDHLAAKDILPIYAPYIDKAEKTFRRLTLHKFKHDIETEFCAAIISELRARLKIEDTNMNISTELEKLRLHCKSLLDENIRISNQWQQEREKLLQQIGTLSEQLVQKKRAGNIYKPDFMASGSSWDTEAPIPDFTRVPSKGVKELLELETKLASEAAEKERLKMELDATSMKYQHLLEQCKQIPELQNQIDELNQRIEELLRRIAEQDDTIVEQQKEIADFLDQLASLKKAYDGLDNDHLALQNTIDVLNMGKAESIAENEKLKRQIADLLKRVAAAEAERDRYKQQVAKGEPDRNLSLVDINSNTLKSARLPGSPDDIESDTRALLSVKQFLYELTGFNLLGHQDGFTEAYVDDKGSSQDGGLRTRFSCPTPGRLPKPMLPDIGPRTGSRAPSRKGTPKSTVIREDSASIKVRLQDQRPSVGSIEAALVAATATTPWNVARSASGKRSSKNVVNERVDTEDVSRHIDIEVTPCRGSTYTFIDTGLNPAYFNPGVENPYDNAVSGFYKDRGICLSKLTDRLGIEHAQLRTVRDLIGRFFSGDPNYVKLLRLLAEGSISPDLIARILAGLHTGELRRFLEDLLKADDDGNLVRNGDKQYIAGRGMVEGEPLSSEAASLSDYVQSKKGHEERYLRNGAQRQPDSQESKEDYNDGVPLALPPKGSDNYDKLKPDINSHRSVVSNIDELSTGGTEMLPSGLLGFWKQTQTMLSMDDMEELLALRELMLDKGTNTNTSKKNRKGGYSSISRSSSTRNLYGSDGHVSKDDGSTDPSSARGIPPDILKDKQIATYIDERLQIERERVRDEVTAEQELDNIEKMKVAVEVAANTMDFWCQVNYDDSESDEYGTKKGGAVMQKVQNAIDRFAKPGKPGFQVKYDRTPKDWTVKGVFARLYQNAEEIRARLNMKRAEHQKREALLYAKYLRSQNSILKDDGLLVTASEYDNVSKRYAQEVQKWNDEVKKLAVYDGKQEDLSKTPQFSGSNVRGEDAFMKTGKMSTADLIEEVNSRSSKEHLIRITSVSTKSPDMDDIIVNTSSIRSAPRGLMGKQRDRITTVFDMEGSSIRGTPRSSMTGSSYRNLNNTPRESISGSQDVYMTGTPATSKNMFSTFGTGGKKLPGMQLTIKDHSTHHSLKQQGPGQIVYGAELVTMSSSDSYSGSKGSKPILIASGNSGNPLPYINKKSNTNAIESAVVDAFHESDIRPTQGIDNSGVSIAPVNSNTSCEPNTSLSKSSKVLQPLTSTPEHIRPFSGKGFGTGKIVYDQYGKPMPAQEIQDIIAYKYIFGNSSVLKVKDMGRRLLVSVPDSSQLIEVSKETLRTIKENVDKLVEYFKVPGISNLYGNDVVGRATSAKRDSNSAKLSTLSRDPPIDDRLDCPAVCINRDALLTTGESVQREKGDLLDFDRPDLSAIPGTPITLQAEVARSASVLNIEPDIHQSLTDKENVDTDFLIPSTIASSAMKKDRYGVEKELEDSLATVLRKNVEALESFTPPLRSSEYQSQEKQNKDNELVLSDLNLQKAGIRDPYAEKINHLDEEGSVTPNSLEYGLSVVEVTPNKEFNQQREEAITLNSFRGKHNDRAKYRRENSDCVSDDGSIDSISHSSGPNQLDDPPTHFEDIIESTIEDAVKQASQIKVDTTVIASTESLNADQVIAPEPSSARTQSSTARKSIVKGIEVADSAVSTHSVMTNTPLQGMLSLDEQISLRLVDQSRTAIAINVESPLSGYEKDSINRTDPSIIPEFLTKTTSIHIGGRRLSDDDRYSLEGTLNIPGSGELDRYDTTHSGYEHHRLPSYNPQDSNFVASSLHMKTKPGAINHINTFIQAEDPQARTGTQHMVTASLNNDDLHACFGDIDEKTTSSPKMAGAERHMTVQKQLSTFKHGFVPNNYLVGKLLPQEPFIKGPSGPITMGEPGLLANASESLVIRKRSAEISGGKEPTTSTTYNTDSDTPSQSNIFSQPKLYMSRLHQDLKKARDADGSSLFGKK
ncbi:Coiled-coil protein [Giardia lamblia P15]|uniref:Coiled-coil protein n=1 Tax=Giardia intestinalis (strain P15) TaxID=658858 RepID=E1F3K0_GIAIA|nr:Coiled-coil protein [Giardia lamblia P15]